MGAAKIEYEERLKNWQVQVYPYIIICGPIDNLTSVYVVINGKDCLFENVLLAVEACYKILKALRTWPPLIEHVWMFIERLVYCIKSSKDLSVVETAVQEIEKRAKIVDKYNIPDY